MFLGSMLPQYMALFVSEFRQCVKKIGVSVRWVKLWVRPPLCVSVCWVTLWVCPPLCLSVRWVKLWVRPPLCVSVRWVTLWVRPPLVCVLSLEDNLCWILACFLLRFAAFLDYVLIVTIIKHI